MLFLNLVNFNASFFSFTETLIQTTQLKDQEHVCKNNFVWKLTNQFKKCDACGNKLVEIKLLKILSISYTFCIFEGGMP